MELTKNVRWRGHSTMLEVAVRKTDEVGNIFNKDTQIKEFATKVAEETKHINIVGVDSIIFKLTFDGSTFVQSLIFTVKSEKRSNLEFNDVVVAIIEAVFYMLEPELNESGKKMLSEYKYKVLKSASV